MDDRFIDRLLNRRIPFGKTAFTALDMLFLAALCLLALIARLYLFPLESADWRNCLSPWFDEIRRVGAWKSVGMTISNYPSPYMYLMSLVSGFENRLFALKAVSVVFDFIGAAVFFLLAHHLTRNTRKSILAMAAILLCPTVVFNSAWWCQCDMIYSTFILAAIYCLFKERSAACCIFLGVALSFKVQTVLLLPFIIIMWLNNRTVKIWHLLFVPVVYMLMNVPALIAGRSLFDILATYYAQSGYYAFGTLKFPNLYVFLNETEGNLHHMEELGGFGICFSMILLGALAYYLYAKKRRLDDTMVVTIAILSLSLALYTLPHMHDRYGFLVDLLAILYAVQRPGKAFVAVGYITISLFTYMAYLTDITLIPDPVLALLLLGLDVYIGYDLHCQLNEAKPIPFPNLSHPESQ